MAVTKESMGLTEAASVERKPREEFQPGDYVRTRHLFLDNDPTFFSDRPLDYGQVRDPRQDGAFISVRWSRAGCGCDVAQEDPTKLVKVTEAEHNAFTAGFGIGHNVGYDAASEAHAPTKPVWPS